MITVKELDQAKATILKAKDLATLERLRLKYLGRKGSITQVLRSISSLKESERAAAGATANKARQDIEASISKRVAELKAEKLQMEVAANFDLTAPGAGPRLGHLHPVEEIQKQLIEIFWQLGFSVADGPEVETDWYCFEALNMPVDHPARDMQDTFYLENGAIPRTHTSNVQIRYMEEHPPNGGPIRIIAPGKVYRNEDEDATHSWAFRQVEGLVVDKGITLADLKGTLLYMLKGIFGDTTELRLRPNYFPYTEPSVEMDARLNEESPWIELGGAGMVHPQVLRNAGINPEEYSGFAFGFGLERIAVIKYGVKDIRYFWRPDLKFLEQF